MMNFRPYYRSLLGLTALAGASACANEPMNAERMYAPPAVAVEGTTTIRVPEGLGTLAVTSAAGGAPTQVECSVCHGPAGSQDALALRATSAEDFHASIQLVHGNLTCLSCHTEDRRDAFHLADGGFVAAEDSIQLCQECHGPQFRDYTNGSHGGMNGYWDLSRGDRTRNHCVDCHSPHAPAYPKMLPAPRAVDRLSTPSGGSRP